MLYLRLVIAMNEPMKMLLSLSSRAAFWQFNIGHETTYEGQTGKICTILPLVGGAAKACTSFSFEESVMNRVLP